jgi:hypothetical protein
MLTGQRSIQDGEHVFSQSNGGDRSPPGMSCRLLRMGKVTERQTFASMGMGILPSLVGMDRTGGFQEDVRKETKPGKRRWFGR